MDYAFLGDQILTNNETKTDKQKQTKTQKYK